MQLSFHESLIQNTGPTYSMGQNPRYKTSLKEKTKQKRLTFRFHHLIEVEFGEECVCGERVAPRERKRAGRGKLWGRKGRGESEVLEFLRNWGFLPPSKLCSETPHPKFSNSTVGSGGGYGRVNEIEKRWNRNDDVSKK